MSHADDDHDDDPHKNPSDLNSKIVLAAIVSLSFVVILVIVLHIYARCVLRRQARQRRTPIRSLDLTANPGQSGEPPKTGLDPLIISSLPMFVFKQKDVGDVEVTAIECTVCLSNIENEEMVRLLPNCKHTFHAECIDKWFGSHSTCPICRTEAEPRLQPEAREVPTTTTVAATAPPLELINSTLSCQEGTSNSGGEYSAKMLGSSARLSSFRRILGRDRSSRRLQSCSQEDVVDLERQ